MEWDLGLRGLGLLMLMALGSGVIAQLVAGGKTTKWLWLITAAVCFVTGLLTSEVWFGWATEEDLQPNIDGLSFDEVRLTVVLSAVVVVLVARFVARRTGPHSHGHSQHGSHPEPGASHL
jgi:membrane protein implicated in regulation of membrane protease activity